MSAEDRRALRAEAEQVVAKLSRARKIELLSGADFWNTKGLPEFGISPAMLTDGPHGLRKQISKADHVGLSDSVPATCFPTASALGSTWDPSLLEEIGAALGREARISDVGVLLGPGLNIKRHPAGGRNFEYFSEDPLLAGKAAAAMVRGIQSEGVGACVKHFAANNQEDFRMRLDTVIDERTLRELYLAGFEIAVAEGEPWTAMSSYNLVNGEHTGESHRLLSEILREEWGFDGLVMSDWLAVADRPAGVAAGLDLEMPSSHSGWDARVAAALDSGRLSQADLDRACVRVVELLLRVASGRRQAELFERLDQTAHHELARRAAAAGTVLLANDGLLPLKPGGRVALVGAFADQPRYQGAGSSLVNPTRLDTVLDALRARLGAGVELDYVPGYDPETGQTTSARLAQVRRAAEAADQVIVLIGLPAAYESEGFDRDDLRLPAGQDAIARTVLAANSRTAVVVIAGAPVELDWADQPAALLFGYLGGQAAGSALVDVLMGDVEPGGRLAESFPVAAAQLPSADNFRSHPTQVQYREGLNVGYRFHDSFGVAPRFCFGHGLSYTSFEYSDFQVDGSGTQWELRLTVTNTGERAGAEVVQVYVHDTEASVARPEQELRAFAKVWLEPGAGQQVRFRLGRRAFAIYDVTAAAWLVEAGEFEVRVGASSRDIRLRASVAVESTDRVTPAVIPANALATDNEFTALYGRPLPSPAPLLPLRTDSTIEELTLRPLGRPLYRAVRMIARATFSAEDEGGTDAMLDRLIGQMPLRALVTYAEGRLSFDALDRLIRVLNLGLRR
jgi:Beta-glucosidase-related glycosidases